MKAKITDSFEEYSGNTFGMWIVENKDYENGGNVMIDHQYRLRHLSSGYYLSVGKTVTDNSKNKSVNLIQKSSNISPHQLQLINTPEESTLFEFAPLKTSTSQNEKQIRVKKILPTAKMMPPRLCAMRGEATHAIKSSVVSVY